MNFTGAYIAFMNAYGGTKTNYYLGYSGNSTDTAITTYEYSFISSQYPWRQNNTSLFQINSAQNFLYMNTPTVVNERVGTLDDIVYTYSSNTYTYDRIGDIIEALNWKLDYIPYYRMRLERDISFMLNNAWGTLRSTYALWRIDIRNNYDIIRIIGGITPKTEGLTNIYFAPHNATTTWLFSEVYTLLARSTSSGSTANGWDYVDLPGPLRGTIVTTKSGAQWLAIGKGKELPKVPSIEY